MCYNYDNTNRGGLNMNKQETKKVLKLNDIDRRVLLSYSNISLETGAEIVIETEEIKTIHKNVLLKV
jgi:hypothetical protein